MTFKMGEQFPTSFLGYYNNEQKCLYYKQFISALRSNSDVGCPYRPDIYVITISISIYMGIAISMLRKLVGRMRRTNNFSISGVMNSGKVIYLTLVRNQVELELRMKVAITLTSKLFLLTQDWKVEETTYSNVW